MALAFLNLGIAPVLVRVGVRQGIPSSEITFIRFAVSWALVAALVLCGAASVRPRNWRLLIWRGVFGGFAVLAYFYSVRATSAGKGTLLNYTHSIWANIMAVMILGARPPRGFWITLSLAVSGLWLVSGANFREGVHWGDALGLLSGVLGAAAIMTIKRLRDTDDSFTIFTSFSVIGTLCAAVPALGPWVLPNAGLEPWIWPSAAAWPAMLGMALTTMIGQLLFAHAYRYTSIPLGTVMSLSVPILSAGLSWWTLGEPLSAGFIAGGGLILAACGILGFQESGVVERGAAEASAPAEAVTEASNPAPEPAERAAPHHAG